MMQFKNISNIVRLPSCVVFAVALVSFPQEASSGPKAVSSVVTKVIDGDTVRLSTGETIRYIGIDTPEAGEPFYAEAKKRNSALVLGKRIRAVICAKEPKDRYSRLLAWVWIDGVMVNRTLVKEGLAATLMIPPCGLETKDEFEKAEEFARRKGLGIWSVKSPGTDARRALLKVYGPGQAVSHVGERILVRGKVKRVKKGSSATFIDFGEPKKGFTVVIFAKSYVHFKRGSVDPASYAGKVVEVSGTVSLYRGRAQIIISTPSDIRQVK